MEDWFAPEEMSHGQSAGKAVFLDPRSEGGGLSSTPARAKQLAPRPDGPLTHFASPRGKKYRLPMLPRWMTLGVVLVVLGAAALAAQTPAEKVERLLSGTRLPGVIQTSIGVTRTGTPIPALITNDDPDYFTPKTRVLLWAGWMGRRVRSRRRFPFCAGSISTPTLRRIENGCALGRTAGQP